MIKLRIAALAALTFLYLLYPPNVFSALRLDYYLSAKHPPEAIIVGEIVEINVDPQNTSGFFIGQAQNTFRIKIDQVLWGQQDLTAKTLKIKYPTFDNPLFDPAIPYRVGTVCILIMGYQQDDFYWLNAVLPALQKNFEKIPDLLSAKKFVTKTLLGALANAKSSQEQLQIVNMVAPLLTANESEALIPFVDSPDLSLRRAAVAGLLHATKDPKYLSIVLDDVDHFISTATQEIHFIGSPVEEDFFLIDEDNKNNATLLPIFRLIAKCKNPNMSEFLRGNFLLLLGIPDNTEDLPLIYSFYMDIRNQKPELIKDRSADYHSFRLSSLKAMAAILRLPFDDTIFYNNIYTKPREKIYEEEMYKLIRAEIVKRGVLSQDALATAESRERPKPPPYEFPPPEGLSVSIKCLSHPAMVGEEIIIEFEIHNGSTKNYRYNVNAFAYPYPTRMYELMVKDSRGQPMPNSLKKIDYIGSDTTHPGKLLPGESFKKSFVLNHFVTIAESGRYEIVGTYHPEDAGPAMIRSKPIMVNVEQRTPEQMDVYIKSFKENYAKSRKSQKEILLQQFMYSRDPRVIPVMVEALYYGGSMWVYAGEALANYLPREASIAAVLKAGNGRGLSFGMLSLLQNWQISREKIVPIIAKSLEPNDPGTWFSGAVAAMDFPDDQFVSRLIALAKDSHLHKELRKVAIEALAYNGNADAVKALQDLLKNSDPKTGEHVKFAINSAYTDNRKPGRPLKPEDFPDVIKETGQKDIINQDALNAADSPLAKEDTSYHEPSADGMTLNIRALGEHFKFGDNISIEFEIYNGSTTVYKYNLDISPYLQLVFDAVVKNKAGEAMPVSLGIATDFGNEKIDQGELLPGSSLKRVFPLHKLADISEPGQYEITGIYHLVSNSPVVIFSQPIKILVEEQTSDELTAFIKNLSEEYFKSGPDRKAVIVRKFMHTHDPRTLPIVIDALYDKKMIMNFAWSLNDALSKHFPNESVVDELVKTAMDRGLTDDVVEQLNWVISDLDTDVYVKSARDRRLTDEIIKQLNLINIIHQKVYPIIVKSLEPENKPSWAAGTSAAILFPNDQLTPRLITIAKDSHADKEVRGRAMMALAKNFVDPSITTFKELLSDPDPEIKKYAEEATRNIYFHGDSYFQTGDFMGSLEKIKPLLEKLGQPADRFVDIKDAVDWLNKSIVPYRNYLNYLKTNVLEIPIGIFIPPGFISFSNDDFQRLAETVAGQELKREILIQLYPKETPKKRFGSDEFHVRGPLKPKDFPAAYRFYTKLTKTFHVYQDNKENPKGDVEIENINIPFDKKQACQVAQKSCGVKKCESVQAVEDISSDQVYRIESDFGKFDWVVDLELVCGPSQAYINMNDRTVLCFCAYETH